MAVLEIVHVSMSRLGNRPGSRTGPENLKAISRKKKIWAVIIDFLKGKKFKQND